MPLIPHVPVARPFLGERALARAVEAAYGMRAARIRLISASMRDVYLVTAGEGRYALFLYRHNQRTPEEIAAEWEFVDFLDAGGIAVAPAVRQTSGDLLLRLPAPEGERYAVLSAFVDGEHLRQKYSAGAVLRYGRAIARIHVRADTMPRSLPRPPNDFHCVVGQSVAAFGSIATHRPADVAFLRDAADLLRLRVDALPKNAPHYGMIHGDVIRANAQVSSDNTVTVLDFDLCGPGWRAYDVASYLAVAGTAEAQQAFLSGYQEIRPLDEAEIGWLPLFEAARHIFSLGIPAMNAYHWGSVALSDENIGRSLDALRRCLLEVPRQ